MITLRQILERELAAGRDFGSPWPRYPVVRDGREAWLRIEEMTPAERTAWADEMQALLRRRITH